MEERFYDFLSNLNLIQADIDKESAIELIKESLAHLDGDEDILTSFIAISGEDSEPKVYSLTSKKRLVLNSKNQETSDLDIEKITSITNGTGLEDNTINLDTGEQKFVIKALNPDGAKVINDAFYSGMNEVLPEEKIVEVFNAVPDTKEDEEVLDVEETPILEETEPSPVINEKGPESRDLSSPDDELINKNFNLDDYEKEPKKKRKSSNRPIIYIVGALIIIAVGFFGINVVNYFVHTISAQNEANSLIDLFNQVDEVYTTAVGYANAAPGQTTPEQWNELDQKARDLEKKISEQESNDLTKNLADSVYYYDEAMITAINHGKNYAASSNPYDKSSLQRNLDQANLNRSAVLGFINANYPDLIDKVNNSEDTAPPNYPEAERVEQLIKEAESHPSEGAEKTENSQGS